MAGLKSLKCLSSENSLATRSDAGRCEEEPLGKRGFVVPNRG